MAAWICSLASLHMAAQHACQSSHHASLLTCVNVKNLTVLLPIVLALPQDAFLERHGVKLGFMSAFVKAAGAALQYVPAVNGVIDGNDIIYR